MSKLFGTMPGTAFLVLFAALGSAQAQEACENEQNCGFCGDGIVSVEEQCDDGNNINGDGCDAYCEIEEEEGGQGCTPGYWKQPHHFDSWAAPYTPGTSFGSVFDDAFPGKTLVDVLRAKGGGLNALGRHTVAALLNSASANVDYDISAAGVISNFNTVYPGSKEDYNAVKNGFANLNEQGCPLN